MKTEHDKICVELSSERGFEHNCYCKINNYDGPTPRFRKIKLGGEWGVQDLGDSRRWMPALDENAWHDRSHNEAGEYDGGEEYAQELVDLYNSEGYEADGCSWSKLPIRPEKPECFMLSGEILAEVQEMNGCVYSEVSGTLLNPDDIASYIDWLSEARDYLNFYGEQNESC